MLRALVALSFACIAPTIAWADVPCTPGTDGRVCSFKQTWEWSALESQRGMAQDEQISNQMHLGAHNAFNHFEPFDAWGYLLPNQYFGLGDQLELGARFLELDVNNAFGSPLVLCHEADQVASFDVDVCDILDLPDPVASCEVTISFWGILFPETGKTCLERNRSWDDGIGAIRDWLDDPSNGDEILILGVEDLAGGPANRAQATDALAGLEDVVFTPDDLVSLERWPTSTEMLARGERIILVNWRDDTVGRDWSFWDSGGLPGGRPDTDWFTCKSAGNLDTNEEDALCFTMESGDRLPKSADRLRATDVADAARKNVNIINMDFIGYQNKEMRSPLEVTFTPCDIVGVPDWLCPDWVGSWTYGVYDMLADFGVVKTDDLAARGSRLAAAVWSWSPLDPAPLRVRDDEQGASERGNGRDQVLLVAPGFDHGGLEPERWVSVADSIDLPGLGALDLQLRYACMSTGRDENGHFSWRVTQARGPWQDGNEHCRAESPDAEDGLDYVFGGPVNGFQNSKLAEVVGPVTHALEVLDALLWVNINDADQDGRWMVNRSPIARIEARPVVPLREGDTLTVGSGDAGPGRVLLTGGEIVIDGSRSDDGDRYRDTLSFSWQGAHIGASKPVIYLEFADGSALLPDDGSYDFSLTVDDGQPAGRDRAELSGVFVANVPPSAQLSLRNELGQTLGDDTPFGLEALEIEAVGHFQDPGVLDTHTAVIDWSDGTVPVDLGDTINPVRANHRFASAGRYVVEVRVTDNDGGTGVAEGEIRVVGAGTAIQFAADQIALLTSGTSGKVRLSIDRAVGKLVGNNGGRASNGALDQINLGNLNAALVKLEQAVELLEGARPDVPALAGPIQLLVMSSKSASMKAINTE